MTAPVPNAQWGVQWEAFAPEDGVMPEQPRGPEQPVPPVNDDGSALTEEQIAAHQAAFDRYVNEELPAFDAAMQQWWAEVDVLLTLDEHWRTLINTYPDEATAREQLPLMRAANEGNRAARDHVLVWAPPVTWTPVEE